MKLIFFTFWIYFIGQVPLIVNEKDRVIIYNDTKYTTTYDVPKEFIGTYKGRKSGYLTLNNDGTGEYKYDIFGFAPANCERAPVKFIWGLVLDKDDNLVKNKRNYGSSYPILLQSTGSNSFQGCRTLVLKDFILDRGKTLHISSSDDWQKTK